ncbi:MAG: ribosome maturation factor RimP [Betaproteobacteria bacterium]|nr:ribosome maturation factor RimP [Betaproteobacteria bacterium]
MIYPLKTQTKERAKPYLAPGRSRVVAATVDVEAIVQSTLDGLGYALVDLELPNRGRFLRVFIDHANAVGQSVDGIKVEDCGRVSKQLQHVLAVDGVEYDRLEVSSPGLDRVLRKLPDFQRFAGCEVELKIRVPRDGRRKFIGVLQGASENGFEIAVDGAALTFGWADLDKARLVPKL